jgi:hypothetical protein
VARSASAQILVGIQPALEHSRYYVENPSTFDTPQPVPHSFEQTYDLDAVWLTVTARYRAGVRWETSAGLTAEHQGRATDYDTFFDPDGTVWITGTSGDAKIRSYTVTQRADISRIGQLDIGIGYRWRLDRATFLPSHKTTTQNGAVVFSQDVGTHEYTSAQLHEVFLRAAFEGSWSPGWRWTAAAELTPASIGRLVIQLPEKYPGVDAIFRGPALGAAAQATLTRMRNRWPVEAAVEARHTWNYRSSAAIVRSSLSVRVSIGRVW